MKTVLKSVALLLLLIGCKDNDKIGPLSPAACNDPMYSHGRELKNVNTIVRAKASTTPGGIVTIYYIDNPDAPNLASPFAACNMPDEFRKDKLHVKISGYMLTWPEMESQNYYGLPTELTKIETR